MKIVLFLFMLVAGLVEAGNCGSVPKKPKCQNYILLKSQVKSSTILTKEEIEDLEVLKKLYPAKTVKKSDVLSYPLDSKEHRYLQQCLWFQQHCM